MNTSSANLPPLNQKAIPSATSVPINNNTPSPICNFLPRLWHKFKLFYLFGFVSIVLIVIALYVIKNSFQPTTHNPQPTTNYPLPTSSSLTLSFPSTETSSWKLYESSFYSLRYPPDWKTDFDEANNLLLVSPAYSYKSKDNNQLQNINYMIKIYPFDFTTKTVDDAIQTDYLRYTNSKNISGNITRSQLVINSIPYKQIFGFPAEIFSVYFSQNQQVFRAALVATGFGDYQYALLADPTTAVTTQTLYKILTTVTPNKTLDTSSWEEYRNETYKFSIKLPPILGYGGDTGFGVYFDFPPENKIDGTVKDSLYFMEATDSAEIRDIKEKPNEGYIADSPFWRGSVAETADSPSEITTYIAHNDGLFKIMLRNYTGKYVSIYNRIIATLKFL